VAHTESTGSGEESAGRKSVGVVRENNYKLITGKIKNKRKMNQNKVDNRYIKLNKYLDGTPILDGCLSSEHEMSEDEALEPDVVQACVPEGVSVDRNPTFSCHGTSTDAVCQVGGQVPSFSGHAQADAVAATSPCEGVLPLRTEPSGTGVSVSSRFRSSTKASCCEAAAPTTDYHLCRSVILLGNREEGEANMLRKTLGGKAVRKTSGQPAAEAIRNGKSSLAEATRKSSSSEATHCDDVSAVGYHTRSQDEAAVRSNKTARDESSSKTHKTKRIKINDEK